MINTIKNYFSGLNRQTVIIGSILVITFILAGVSASGLSLLGTGAIFMFSGVLFYKKFNLNNEGFTIEKRILIPALIILATALASVFFADNHYLALRAFLTIVVLFAVIVSAKNISKNQLSIGVSAISIATFLYAIYEYFSTVSTTVIRLEGFAGYANTFGLYATVFGLIALYCASYINSKKLKWLMFLIASMDFFVAFMTLSRGVLLAVIISAVLTSVLFYKKINFKKVLSYAGIVFIISALLVTTFTSIKKYTYHEKIDLIRTDSTLIQASGTRLQHFSTATRMFKDHTFGIGAGNYPQMSFNYEIKPIDNAVDPHSFIMTLLAEYGVFIIFWFYLLFEIIRSLVINKNNFDQEKVFYLFISLAFVLHIFVDSDMRQPFTWLILAIVLGKLLNFDKSFKFKKIEGLKVGVASLLILPGMLILFASSLLINFYDTTGTYAELKSKDRYVLFAAKLLQVQPDVWENSARMALSMATVSKSPEDTENAVNDLIYRTDKAMAITGPQSRQYSFKARGYAILRQEQNYKEALEKSVSLSKFHSYNERSALAGYYTYSKNYTALKELVLSTYTMNQEYFGSAYASADPEKSKKYMAMDNMLELLKSQATLNKDKNTILVVTEILNKLKPIIGAEISAP
jgi:hypothetical protein